MPSYRVVLARARDGWLNPIGEVPATQLRFDYGLSRPGSARISVNARQVGMTLNRKSLDPNRTGIYIFRDGTIVWAGLLLDVAGGNQATFDLVAEEFTGQIEVWRLKANTITSAYSIAIAQSIITACYTETGAPAGVTPEVVIPTAGPVIDPGHALGGSGVGWPYGPIWYEYENHFGGDLLRELQRVGQHTQVTGGAPSASSEGFEWTQEVVTDSPTYKFRIWAPRAGWDRASFTIEHGTGTTQNVARLDSWSRSSRNMATHMRVVGLAGSTPSQSQRADVVYSTALDDGYVRREVIYSDPYARTFQEATAIGLDRIARVGKPQVQVRCALAIGQGRWEFGQLHVGDRVPTRIISFDHEVCDETLRITSLGYSVEKGQELAHLDLQTWIPYFLPPSSVIAPIGSGPGIWIDDPLQPRP